MYELFLLPTNEHKDNGLLVTGRSFKESAEILAANDNQLSPLESRLPICYLYRHSLELFLKSMIVIASSHFDTAFTKKNEIINLNDGNANRPINKAHSLRILLENLQHALINSNYPPVSRIPECLDYLNKIESDLLTIDDLDLSSTFFRYPNGSKDHEKDKVKSRSKKSTPNEVKKHIDSEIPTMLYIDNLGKEEHLYLHDKDKLSETLNMLTKTSESLSDIALAFYFTETQ